MTDRIRQVKAADLDGVARVEALCFPPEEAAERSVLEVRIKTFPESFFVAEEDGIVVGFINGAVTDSKVIEDRMFEDCSLHRQDGAYQSIFGLDVLPDYQRRGIARELMNRLIEDAGKRGRKGVILTCKDGLIPFYESFGYQNAGRSESVHGGAVWYDMILDL